MPNNKNNIPDWDNLKIPPEEPIPQKKYKKINIFKKYQKIIIAALIIIAISISAFFIFRATGITDTETLRKFISDCGPAGWIVFLLLQIIITVFLCFIPGTSMIFIALGVILYGSNFTTFLLCFSGVILSSVGMDLVGRFGGSKLIKKLIGASEYENALGIVREKGIVYVPIFYLVAGFPDDAICMVCGAIKIKFWVHLIEIITCRGIGVATIVFGVNILPTELTENLKNLNWSYIGSHLWDYIVVVTVLVFWILMLLKIAGIIDKKIGGKNRDENKTENKTN